MCLGMMSRRGDWCRVPLKGLGRLGQIEICRSDRRRSFIVCNKFVLYSENPSIRYFSTQ
jgi:hypothetical protein